MKWKRQSSGILPIREAKEKQNAKRRQIKGFMGHDQTDQCIQYRGSRRRGDKRKEQVYLHIGYRLPY